MEFGSGRAGNRFDNNFWKELTVRVRPGEERFRKSDRSHKQLLVVVLGWIFLFGGGFVPLGCAFFGVGDTHGADDPKPNA